MSESMSESNTDAAKPRTVVGDPGAAAGRRSRAEGHRSADGITITRWSLGLSLTIALTVLTGAFTLVWDETTTLRETQVEIATRVSGLEVEVRGLREDVTALQEDVAAIREDVATMREDVATMREDVATIREELRESVGALREEIEELGDLIRSRETPGVDTQ